MVEMAVSVVVRCAGRERLFANVLEFLLRQTVVPSEILIVMDCDSEEEIRYVSRHLENYPNSRLLTFKHAEFSHPYSVNVGIASSKEELVCITNGHSLPTSLHWLASGVRHFKDEKVAGVGGFFLPSTNRFANSLFYTIEGPMKRITWLSTINCVIRKAMWEEYHFDEELMTLIPETRKYGGDDYDWSLEMLSRGYRIVLDPAFNVIHAHEKDMALEIYRNLRNYFIYKRLREKIKRLRRPRQSFESIYENSAAKSQ